MDAERAAQLDPRNAKAHFRQGQAFRKLRRPADAVVAFVRVLSVMPTDVAAREELKKAQTELGQLKGASAAAAAVASALATVAAAAAAEALLTVASISGSPTDAVVAEVMAKVETANMAVVEAHEEKWADKIKGPKIAEWGLAPADVERVLSSGDGNLMNGPAADEQSMLEFCKTGDSLGLQRFIAKSDKPASGRTLCFAVIYAQPTWVKLLIDSGVPSDEAWRGGKFDGEFSVVRTCAMLPVRFREDSVSTGCR